MAYRHFVSSVIYLFAVNALAALGENLKTDIADKAGVTVSKLQSNSFTKHESVQSKLSVRQFASTNGTVFAVAWSGRSHPDLRSLLGTHFGDYQAALAKFKTQHKGHCPIQLDVNGLHTEQSGPPRAVSGRAWLTGALPDGIDTNDIK